MAADLPGEGRGFSEAALVLSSLTYAVGATANGLGGLVGDWMVRRYGLRNGRRWLGVAGLSAAALFLTAAIFAPDGKLALVFLSCRLRRYPVQQPTLCALCLDIGRQNAGAVFGFMNTAANVSSALSAVIFGYLVGYSGNYDTPFIPMVALLASGSAAVGAGGSDHGRLLPGEDRRVCWCDQDDGRGTSCAGGRAVGGLKQKGPRSVTVAPVRSLIR